jgi:hypothetical protein
VIVRVKVPAVADLQETVAVPEALMLVGEIATHVSPLGTVSVRLTVPVNPLAGEIVIVDVAELSITMAAGDVAATVKSVIVNVAVAVWTTAPLEPVIVRI